MNLEITRVQPPERPDVWDIRFEAKIHNQQAQAAQIVTLQIELWLITERRIGESVFLGPLRPDFRRNIQFQFEPNRTYDFPLMWSCSPSDL